MTPFAEELKRSRISAGYKTARGFFDWIKSKGIGFNYSYYMRLEQGALPSEKVVAEVASTVKKDSAERLILAYCQSLFPRQAYLFTHAVAEMGSETELAPRESASVSPEGQKELTLRQVAALAENEATYHLFLLSTLARRLVRMSELEPWFSAKSLKASLNILTEAGLVSVTKDAFEQTSVEMRFPEAYNADLKAAYAKFDTWDETFGSNYGLEKLVNKMIVRRVSGRYLALVRKQLEVLFDLTKASDEVDQRYNDSVLQLKVSLRQGKLPG